MCNVAALHFSHYPKKTFHQLRSTSDLSVTQQPLAKCRRANMMAFFHMRDIRAEQQRQRHSQPHDCTSRIHFPCGCCKRLCSTSSNSIPSCANNSVRSYSSNVCSSTSRGIIRPSNGIRSAGSCRHNFLFVLEKCANVSLSAVDLQSKKRKVGLAAASAAWSASTARSLSAVHLVSKNLLRDRGLMSKEDMLQLRLFLRSRRPRSGSTKDYRVDLSPVCGRGGRNSNNIIPSDSIARAGSHDRISASNGSGNSDRSSGSSRQSSSRQSSHSGTKNGRTILTNSNSTNQGGSGRVYVSSSLHSCSSIKYLPKIVVDMRRNCRRYEANTLALHVYTAEKGNTWAPAASVTYAREGVSWGAAGTTAMHRIYYASRAATACSLHTAVEATSAATDHSGDVSLETVPKKGGILKKEGQGRVSCEEEGAATAEKQCKLDCPVATDDGHTVSSTAKASGQTVAGTTSAGTAPPPAAKQGAAAGSPAGASGAAGRKNKESEAEEAAARARAAEELWNTLVPERHWGLQSPMFWILLVLVLVTHAYNNKREREKAQMFTDQDSAEEELRVEVEKRRQDRRLRQTKMKNQEQHD